MFVITVSGNNAFLALEVDALDYPCATPTDPTSLRILNTKLLLPLPS